MALRLQFIPMLLLSFLGGSQGCHARNKAPSIKCPYVSPTHTADPGKSTATVIWDEPKATAACPNDKTPSVEITQGFPSGSNFENGQSHTVRYTATDERGLTDSCRFSFTVKEIRCPFSDTNSPLNGRSNCTGHKYRDTCSYSCNHGYSLSKDVVINCTKSGKWDKPPPKCQVNSCGALPKPPNTLTPPFECDREYNYRSVCLLKCDQPNGYIPSQGLTTRCTETGTWETTVFQCKDIEAPEFSNCPTQTIHQTLESGSSKTSIVWPQITAKDNSNQLQPITTSTGATLVGGQFEEGTHIVRFDVKDDAGNKAEPCIFIVQIERVECDPPDFQGKYITISQCTPPFEEGTICKLGCRFNITRNGSAYITCKKTANDNTAVGYWDWGQNETPPKDKPFCQVAVCPKLSVPENGAMACDEWSGGEMCSIVCNDNFDVVGAAAPVNFVPKYVCYRKSETWDPSFIPECLAPILPNEIRMEAAYIFNGPCDAAKDAIKQKFIQNLDAKHCADPNCNTDNVVVVCGDARKKRSRGFILRRHRRASFSFIKFTLVKKNEFDPSSTAKPVTDTTVSSLDQVMLDIKANVTFVVSGNIIKATSLRKLPPVTICPNGYVRGRDSRTLCVACPRGMFYNSEKLCQVCPVGQYQNVTGSVQCKTCPVGQSTLAVGSKTITQCLDTCPPGQWSSNGLSPCSVCVRGTYSSTYKSKHCTPCSEGTTTDGKGSDLSTLCKPYDMLLQGPVMVNTSVVASSPTCTMTFGVWAKIISDEGISIQFEIYRHQEVTFSLKLRRLTNLTEDSTDTESDRSHLVAFVNDGWHHMAVVVTTGASTVYKNGEQYLTVTNGESSCPIPETSSLRLNVSNSSSVFLRDLNVISSTAPTVVTSLSTSCSSNLVFSIFSLQHLNMRTMDRVMEVTPSTCLNDGVCKSKPCGNHDCIVTSANGDFRCHCRGGYSGTRCQIAPDHCSDNQCANGSTCISDVMTGMYSCVCQNGVTGKLCDEHRADGEWSLWSEWGGCSKSCSKGISTRERVCEGPGETYNPCQGNSFEIKECQLRSCPECNADDLKMGGGATIDSCSGDSHILNCTIKCKEGHVYKDTPVEYSCSNGDWTPDRFTQSCTAPVTPVSVGIKYTIVFRRQYPKSYLQAQLLKKGNNVQCVRRGRCRVTISVMPCNINIPTCVLHNGNMTGYLFIFEDVEPGLLNISTSQISIFMDLLFDSSEVFRNESTETFTPEYRPLEISVDGSHTLVYPHSHEDQAIEVPEKFGQILSNWKEMDMANKELRKDNYSFFNISPPEGNGEVEMPYVLADQVLACPENTVSGGLFCVTCAPGTYYFESTCQPCAQGFYQEEEGQLECKPCPEGTSTPILGASRISMCEDITV